MKQNLNPIAAAEQGLAVFLAGVPAVSAILDAAGTGEVPVFAATTENIEQTILRQISQGVGQIVVVAFERTTEVLHGTGTPARVVFSVTVTSPGVLAENAIRSTTDLGCAIIEAIEGVQFDLPFFDGIPCTFESWTQGVDMSGAFSATLEFGAALNMTAV